MTDGQFLTRGELKRILEEVSCAVDDTAIYDMLRKLITEIGHD